MSNLHRYADYLPLPVPDRFNAPTFKRNKIAPLSRGAAIPEAGLPRTQFINPGALLEDAGEQTDIRTLVSRPLVVAFISLHWNGYAEKLLQDLHSLYADIRIMGGELLVISDEDSSGFASLTQKQAVPFSTVWDRQHKIATQFGIYSSSDPIWDRISGVNADVPVPAVYVLDPSGKIVFGQVDHYFENRIPARDLLSAVYDAASHREKAA
ncbi:MAG TPA: redoxin domain-containing protein [Chitinophaga sp.]